MCKNDLKPGVFNDKVAPKDVLETFLIKFNLPTRADRRAAHISKGFWGHDMKVFLVEENKNCLYGMICPRLRDILIRATR